MAIGYSGTIEDGKRFPSSEMTERIAIALGRDSANLFGITPSRQEWRGSSFSGRIAFWVYPKNALKLTCMASSCVLSPSARIKILIDGARKTHKWFRRKAEQNTPYLTNRSISSNIR